MTAGQGIRDRWKKTVEGRTWVILPGELTDRLMGCAVRLLLTAVVSGGVILDGRAPFGAAMVGASGAGLTGAAALLGACLGCLCQLELEGGLRYAAASILVYALAFAVYDLRPLRRAWFSPLLTGGVLAFTGWATGDWADPARRVGLVGECALAVGAVWCFRAGLRRGKTSCAPTLPGVERRRGLGVLWGAVLLSLVPLRLAGLSLGRVLAGATVLLGTWAGGGSVGGVLGLLYGAAMDLTAPGQALYGPVWGLAALGAGQGAARGRGALCALWVGLTGALLLPAGEHETLMAGVESLLALPVLLLWPPSRLDRLRLWFAPAAASAPDPGGVAELRRRLEETARAYAGLCQALRESMAPPDNDEDISAVFDRAAGRICRGCSLRGRCWQQEYSTTFGALNDATPAMVERGSLEPGDLPAFFAHRCIRLNDFVRGVNEELSALFYRRQYRARVRENRGAVCRQYDQLSALLSRSAMELGEEWLPEPRGREKLGAHLARRGDGVTWGLYRDGRGLLRLELEGPGCPRLNREGEVARLSQLLGASLRVCRAGPESLSLVEEEPFKALAGVACRKKDGETVSGDAGTWFKRADGKVYLLLCDGMGSGPAANRESTLAIRLLEQFLNTGIPARQALSTIVSALALRGEETGGFTTVDLLELDLFTGESTVYKLGAAPTYVKQGEAIRRLAGKSLPAGLAEGGEDCADSFPLRLAPGDWVLMISDGVCVPGEDGWLLERLSTCGGDSPRQLAAELVSRSPQGATDDRTAMAVRLERR